VATYRDSLPQLDTTLFLTDGGLETTLIFDDGFELPDFAAFVLLNDDAGRDALVRYFDAYVAIAKRDGVGIVLETPTWRASSDWAERLGYSPDELDEANRVSVALLLDARNRHQAPGSPMVISGCIGPRGDGYHPDFLMTPVDAAAYHARQIAVLTAAGVDLITAITMTSPEEAVGIAAASRSAGVPVVISFTVETDGALPTGQSLADAITAVDRATDAYPSYYMINCAHPTHFSKVLEPGADWTSRIHGIRANASRRSHAELDEAEDLDAGDPAELAREYVALRSAHPHLVVLGGCCGTSDRHIDAISTACAGRK
jgi:S-methylmethionine-dependent homocysteine/selenocysteine methylase